MSTREAMTEEWRENERLPYWNGIRVRLKTPMHSMYKRLIDVAVEEARDVRDGLPTDEAVLAIDWLLRKADPKGSPTVYLMSMENCCNVLESDVRRLRGNIRQYLGYQTICTAQADHHRLFALTSKPLADDVEELFEDFRVVPALDQRTLFGPEVVN